MGAFLELSALWNVGYTGKCKVFSRELGEQALENGEELDAMDPFRGQVSLELLENGVSSIHG